MELDPDLLIEAAWKNVALTLLKDEPDLITLAQVQATLAVYARLDELVTQLENLSRRFQI